VNRPPLQIKARFALWISGGIILPGLMLIYTLALIVATSGVALVATARRLHMTQTCIRLALRFERASLWLLWPSYDSAVDANAELMTYYYVLNQLESRQWRPSSRFALVNKFNAFWHTIDMSSRTPKIIRATRMCIAWMNVIRFFAPHDMNLRMRVEKW